MDNVDKGIEKLNTEYKDLTETQLVDLIIYSSMELSLREENKHLTPHAVLRTILDAAPDEDTWPEVSEVIKLERAILE